MYRQELIQDIESLLDIDCTLLYHTSEIKDKGEREFFRALLKVVAEYKILKCAGL